MKLIVKIRSRIACVFFVCTVVGCSANPPEASEPILNPSSRFDQLVSEDVVSVFMQIDRLSPTTTTLGTSDSSLQQGAFAEALKNAFQTAGYAMRTVAAGPNTIPLSFQMEIDDQDKTSEVAQDSRTVTVTVGDVAVRRTYIAGLDGEITPAGGMQVRGVDARRLQLDNGIFSVPAGKGDLNDSPAPSAIIVEADQQMAGAEALVASPENAVQASEQQQSIQAPAKISASVAPVKDRLLLDLVAPSVATAKPRSLDAFTALPDKDTRNVRELQQSNFESLFSEMGIVGEKVLTFDNDSTRMGNVNKARLRELLTSFNPNRDILSVVGCSLGPTSHTGGQEGLARGRAMRVREELLYAGVPDSQILAEGCWAEESFDERMPRRGVVVTLKRPIT